MLLFRDYAANVTLTAKAPLLSVTVNVYVPVVLITMLSISPPSYVMLEAPAPVKDFCHTEDAPPNLTNLQLSPCVSLTVSVYELPLCVAFKPL